MTRVTTLALLFAGLLLAHPVAAQTSPLPATGNVGIGTTGPAANLDVQRVHGDSSDIVRIGSDQNYYFGFARSNTTGALSIQGNQTGNNNILLAPISGNVGIGTPAPQSRLHVAGNLAVDGTISAKYQDISE